MLDFGWRKKAEKLRLIILSTRLDQPLSPEMATQFEIQRKFHKGQIDAEELMRVTEALKPRMKPWEGLWEPFSDMRGNPQAIYGWTIRASMYQLNDQNWWLVRAERKPSNKVPEKDLAMLGKILDVLGGHVEHDALSVGELVDNVIEGVPFMWTWFNQAPLYEVQVNKDKKKPEEMIRVVPRGTRGSDGYQSLDDIIEKDP